MTETPLEIAVIIVAYNNRDDLAGCLAGVERWAAGDTVVHTVMVDCDSDDGSADLVDELFPDIDLLQPGANLGYAGGNNLGWDHVQRTYPGVKYVALLNPDTVPAPGWLDPLIDRLRTQPDTATCQPLITLHGRRGLINTAGNRAHYLGFGLVTRCNEPIPDDLQTHEIGYCSGAAMLVRADLIAEHGLFEPQMFLYCEDTDLGWKLSQLGHKHELVPESLVAHKFDDKAAIGNHYYFLERNRLWLVFVYYKWPTLLLLVPPLLLMEIGQVLFTLTRGMLGEKVSVWAYFLDRDSRRHILDVRREAQDRRTVGDRRFARNLTGWIRHPSLGGPLMDLVANPLLATYWWLLRRLIFW